MLDEGSTESCRSDEDSMIFNNADDSAGQNNDAKSTKPTSDFDGAKAWLFDVATFSSSFFADALAL